MGDLLPLLLAGTAGVLLGAAFFGGLWWTVRKAIASPQPEIWVLSSLVLRMTVALFGFYIVSGGEWQRLLVCLVGFVVARFAVTWFTRPARSSPSATAEEPRYAP